LMKISFYPGTHMAQAAAEVSAFSNRIQGQFPPGSQPPFIIRFDASTLPVGQLVLSSPTRSNNELLDLANVYVRSSFTSIPGLVAPPPFGGNVRTIVIKANPDEMAVHNLTPDQLVQALRLNNQTTPSGNVRVGDLNYLTPTNTTIKSIKDFEKIPLYKTGVQNNFPVDPHVDNDIPSCRYHLHSIEHSGNIFLWCIEPSRVSAAVFPAAIPADPASGSAYKPGPVCPGYCT